MSQKNSNDKKKNGKYDLAKIVLLWGLGSVSILGVVAIVFVSFWGTEADRIDSVKDILILLLPVIGAWVGTILAFYFSKENYESASDKSRQLYAEFRSPKEKLESIIAKDVMIKIEDADKLILDKPESEVFLKKDLIDGNLEKDKNNPRNRLPILNTAMIAKYIVHRSIIDKFIVEMVVLDKNIEDLTLQDMLNEPKYLKMITESFGTIKDSSNLLEAKDYIDRITICLDVFVTKTGEPDSPVIGWITNAIVTKESNI